MYDSEEVKLAVEAEMRRELNVIADLNEKFSMAFLEATCAVCQVYLGSWAYDWNHHVARPAADQPNQHYCGEHCPGCKGGRHAADSD